MRRPEYPIWSAISILCVLIPAPWHWKTRNVATISVIIWLGLYNGVNLINSILWADHYRDIAPIWSDISCRITALINFAIPLCSLAQMRRLAAVIGPQAALLVTQKAQKRRLITEFIICIVLPILMLPVLYTIQGHRYDIYENIGPVLPAVVTWVAVVVQRLVPLLISILSLMYGAIAMRRFRNRRTRNRAVALVGSKLTTSVYLRLLGNVACNCIAIMFLTLWYFLNRILMWSNGMVFTLNWADTHAAFEMISQVAESATSDQMMTFSSIVPFWVGILYGILFFLFWGFGEEAITSYLSAWAKIKSFIFKEPQTTEPIMVPSLGSTAVSINGFRRNDDAGGFGHGGALDQSQTSSGIGYAIYEKSEKSKIKAMSTRSGISVKVETVITEGV